MLIKKNKISILNFIKQPKFFKSIKWEKSLLEFMIDQSEKNYNKTYNQMLEAKRNKLAIFFKKSVDNFNNTSKFEQIQRDSKKLSNFFLKKEKSIILTVFGYYPYCTNHYDEALAIDKLQASITLLKKIKEEQLQMKYTFNLVILLRKQGNYKEAKTLYNNALKAYQYLSFQKNKEFETILNNIENTSIIHKT